MRLRARAFTPLISEVRVFEDGVSPSQPEAKCEWARGGCSGDQFLRLGGKPFHRGASNQNREGQVLGVQYPTHSNLCFRVYEDGVKLIKPEAKCDWARGGWNSLCKTFL